MHTPTPAPDSRFGRGQKSRHLSSSPNPPLHTLCAHAFAALSGPAGTHATTRTTTSALMHGHSPWPNHGRRIGMPSTPTASDRWIQRGLGLGLCGLLLALSGCGGDPSARADAATGRALPEVKALQPVPDRPPADAGLALTVRSAGALKSSGPVALATTSPVLASSAWPMPVTDPGVLLLLLPDGLDPGDARLDAWRDAALEVGVRLAPLSDSQFLQMGSAALGFAGLVLPDDLHTVASDTLIEAVRSYTRAGGQTLLSFDFGALTLMGDVPVYPVPKSRLSDLAGVDYVLYDSLRERTTGLGPVVGRRSTLRALLVPPGKSMPYDAGATTALVAAAGSSDNTALYLPTSQVDPGGARGFDAQQYAQMRYASGFDAPGQGRQVQVDYGRAFKSARVDTRSTVNAQSLNPAVVDDPLHAYHGYLLGNLIYPSYVTQGTFGDRSGQQVLATSPQFGLVAGVNPVGAGRVLFVNLPLTYLKGRTDALMMHGFLRYFAHEMLGLAQLSAMPGGVAGLTFDWHIDAKAAQAPLQKLIQLNVFNNPATPFSIEVTAGPDAIQPGDKLGLNLSSNKTVRQWLTSFAATGHSVGSHGGWIHDYYGLNVGEDNALASTRGACVNSVVKLDNYLQCLVLNRRAVDTAVGKPSRTYSAPEGNNPRWAMDWQEQQGVVGAYFGGHTGLGATRQYRDGALRNPKLWMFPVTPQGLYATFEEFQAYGVPQSEVIAWYRELVDFSLAVNSSRLVYAHPPGAALWTPVLQDLLSYARSQGGRFAWYTMPTLADFLTRRLDVQWSQSPDPATGQMVWNATHPTSLSGMTWRLPRTRFANAPQVTSGNAQVITSDPQFWIVRADGGSRLQFKA